MANQEERRYNEKFCRFSSSIEKWLLLLIMMFLSLLLVTQSLLTVPQIRAWLVETERLEGNTEYLHFRK